MSGLEQFQEFDDTIRKVAINGVMYFSVIDVFKNYGSGSTDVHKEWERAKERLEEEGFEVGSHLKLHQFSGQGQRQTPLITMEIWRKMVSILGTSHFSQNKQSKAEVTQLHPLVGIFLANQGWEFEHHYKLPSGKIIDVVAWNGPQTQIIECKTNLMDDQKLFGAIGQVLCYCSEFKMDSQPTLATYKGKITLYGLECCHDMDIQIIEIAPPYTEFG
ncbi:MAG: hypothetical protein BroJett018_28440 [Chloroflexota bacterium]|nr:hypothetical protein [Chloroflexota bacterium]NOG63718.1 hypothetical protein [Chloroflexota bacterium]GIK65050.1 MAG: hypothetical protein BroJett018_28440 [Chloroflexota bacterium]